MCTTYPYKIYTLIENLSLDSNALLELVTGMIEVYFFDIDVKRNDNEEIALEIPTYYSKNLSVQEILEETANYMCNGETTWKLKANNEKIPALYNTELFNLGGISGDSINLFSGGLDSYCGLYSNYSKGKNAIYLNFQHNKYEFGHALKEFLYSKLSEDRFVRYSFFNKKQHLTQRTRTLIFMAISILVATALNIKEINIFENGLFSLNPNLNHSRRTTKTTHPRVIRNINYLLKKINSDIRISNPFLCMTKGEVINSLDTEFKKEIKLTVTCGSSRQNPKFDNSKNKQCGVCPACVFRQISLSAFDNEEYDAEYDYNIYNGLDTSHLRYPEFKSSLFYFNKLQRYIKEKTIYKYLDLDKEVYQLNDYFEQTKKMLCKFSDEYDYFKSKYINKCLE